MQIQINTDASIKGREALTAKVTTIVKEPLARFSEYLTRIEVHLSDENNGKSHVHDHRCMLEARLQGRQPVAVILHAADLEQAVRGATDKLARRLSAVLGRQHDHRGHPSNSTASDAGESDLP